MSYRQSNNLAVVSNNEFLIEEYPLEKYSKHLPNWFKDMKVDLSEYNKDHDPGRNHTAKSCSGMWDFFKTGYLLRFNFDITLNIQDSKNFDYHPEPHEDRFKMTWFDAELYGMHTPIKTGMDMMIKLVTPFKIVSNKSTRVLFTDPFYNYEQKYRIVPGIVDPHYVNDVNIIIEPLVKQIQIKRGDPALLMFSLDNSKIGTRVATNKDNKLIRKNLYKQNTYGLSWYEKHRANRQ